MTNDIEERLVALEHAVRLLQERSESERAGRARAFWIRIALLAVLVLVYAYFLKSATGRL